MKRDFRILGGEGREGERIFSGKNACPSFRVILVNSTSDSEGLGYIHAMKKIAFLLVVFLQVGYGQENPMDQIDSRQLFIVDQSNNHFYVFGNSDELKSSFGEPNRIDISYPDMVEYGLVKEYLYDGLSVRLEEWPEGLRAISCTIETRNYYFKYNNTIIRIGDHIANLTDVFPKSHRYMVEESLTYLRVYFSDYDNIPYNNQLLIELDTNGKVLGPIRIFSGL